MRIVERLRERIYEAVNVVRAEEVGVAFSGGIDSSLLAKICKDSGKKTTLLTVSFADQREITISNQISKRMELQIVQEVVSLEDLNQNLKKVLSIIEYERIAHLENCVCFYHVFKLASEHGVNIVLSANGMDELFCGYHRYREYFTVSKESLSDLMSNLVQVAKKDKEEIEKIGDLFGIRYLCPFLSENFIDFARKIPMSLKIKNDDDDLRKHVLREVALNVGVPRSAAMRPKKAFQYSSGMHRSIIKLAKSQGFTKMKAKHAGYHSEMEAYIENLKP